MDFKLVVAVFCLASIRVSEAAVAWSSATDTGTVSECVQTGTTVAYTATASAVAPLTIASYAITTQTPTSSPLLFAISSAGVVTTLTTSTSKFTASTQGTYALLITASDSTPTTALTGTMTLTVTVTTCCSSSASFVFPSLAVMLISLVSLLMKNNN